MIPVDGAGLVLRRVRRGEEDLRLTVFLREAGKILVLSRGGQRPTYKLRSVQEPFTEADFHLFVPPDNGVNGRLAGGKLIDSHQGLRGRYDAFETAARAAETVDVLVPFRAPSPDVYDILRAAFRRLSAGSPASVEWVLFVARLLNCLGHGDVTERLTALLGQSESDAAATTIAATLSSQPGAERPVAALPAESPSLERCLTLVNSELERVLPWRLKSDRANADADSKEIST